MRCWGGLAANRTFFGFTNILSCASEQKMLQLFWTNTSKFLREDKRVWQITENRTTADNGKEYATYGVSIGETVINDISTDKHDIQEFVRRLNRLGASEIHAFELVEDFLGR